MAVGFAMQTAVGVQTSSREDASIRNGLTSKAELSARIQASTFARADCSTQVRVLQALIASSRIVVETDVAEDDFADMAEAAENEYDSEMDFIDDDEMRNEDDFSGAYASPNGDGPLPVDSMPRFYEIKITETAPGRWTCIPPLNPLRGYRPNGSDAEAQLILDAVRKQFAFYEAVAKWLQEERDAVLESPVAFRRNHTPMTQTDFLQTEFCAKIRSAKKGTAKKTDTGNVHGYCQNCRLSWEHASLPLDCVFKNFIKT